MKAHYSGVYGRIFDFSTLLESPGRGELVGADCKDGIECLETGFCQDIDECSEAVGTGLTYCGVNTNCINEIGSFRCECQSGYENHVANVGCSDINECLQNPAPGCAKRTDCTNLDGSYECVCRDGYTGDPYSACQDIGKIFLKYIKVTF